MTHEIWRECRHHHHGCACREHTWEERVAGLEAEIEQLKGETYCGYCCTYCGARFLLEASDVKAQIGQHICECPMHPMRIVEAERDAARSELERLKASVFRLEALNEHLEEESGWRDLAALMVEVERLKKAIKTAHADGARAIIASFDHVDPRARICELEAEVERLKGDRAGWAARSQEQFDRIGVALERVREHRETGEPSRDDATEVEALVEQVIHLEIESGHWIVRSMDLEREVERLKAANAKWENELLKELFVWADNWLSDEAKDQGARAVLQKVRAALAGQITSHEAHTWEQERAAVVAWLAEQESDAEAQEETNHEEEVRLYLEARLSTLAQIKCGLENGEHWPEGESP